MSDDLDVEEDPYDPDDNPFDEENNPFDDENHLLNVTPGRGKLILHFE